MPSQVSSGPGWTYDATQQLVQVTGNGAVLSGLYIPYTVSVKASNVTISKDKIVASYIVIPGSSPKSRSRT